MRRFVLWLALLSGGMAYPRLTHAEEISIGVVENIINGASALDLFRRPGGLVADPARGIILIADTGNHRLVAFDQNWRSRGVIVLDEHHVAEPIALALDRRGRIFMVDRIQNRIEVMDARGTHIAFFMPSLPSDPAAASPQDIAIGSSGRIYLLVSGDRPGVCVMDPSGKPIENFGFVPADEGMWIAPQSVAVNADESRIAVTDARSEHVVTVLDAEGRPVARFGKHGEGADAFSLPEDVVWGPNNTLWITDTLRHSVSVFDENGTHVGTFGGFGGGPGQFAYPVGCLFLDADRVVVLERANARCQVFKMEMPSLHRAAGSLDLSGSGSSGTLSNR